MLLRVQKLNIYKIPKVPSGYFHIYKLDKWRLEVWLYDEGIWDR